MSDKDRHRADPPFLIKTQGLAGYSQEDPGTVFGKDDMVAPELRGNSVEIPDLHWLDGAGRNEPLLSLFPVTVPRCTRTRGTGGDRPWRPRLPARSSRFSGHPQYSPYRAGSGPGVRCGSRRGSSRDPTRFGIQVPLQGSGGGCRRNGGCKVRPCGDTRWCSGSAARAGGRIS